MFEELSKNPELNQPKKSIKSAILKVFIKKISFLAIKLLIEAVAVALIIKYIFQ